MAQFRVRWLQRVNGRFPGFEEVVEGTPYLDALVGQRRLEIIEELVPLIFVEDAVAPIVGVFISEPVPRPLTEEELVATNDLGQVLSLDEVGRLEVRERAPKPRPRKPSVPRDGER